MQPYRAVMVPLDGAPLSEQALPLALGVAQRAGAHVFLVRVASARSAPGHSGPREALAPEPYLEALAARLRADTHLPITTALLDAGDDDARPTAQALAEMLHEFATAYRADLIVMTTHGYGGLARLWLGSVADALLRLAEIPLLLLRPATPARSLACAGFERVLVPLDGGPLAEYALAPALALGTPGRSCYMLLQITSPLLAEHIAPPYSLGLPSADAQQLAREAERYLARTAAQIAAHAGQVRTQLVVAEPAEAIVRVAREWGADLIALATHGRGALGRTLLGSVADQVARSADAPVLLVRPTAAAQWQHPPLLQDPERSSNHEEHQDREGLR
jgi:nucleotide-binding universal stress UspA family protein